MSILLQASSTDNLESSLETSSIKLIEESQSSTVINSKTSPPQTEDTASSSESTLSVNIYHYRE